MNALKKAALLAAATVVAFAAATALAVPLLLPTGWLWVMARPALHKDVINRYAAQYKMDPLFVMALVRVESSFVKDARSHRGAVGLMQLMPETGMDMARRAGRKVTLEQLAEPEVNVHLGVHYLSLLRQEFGEDTTAVLAAYNAGPANARAWRKGAALAPEAIPFPETRTFVRRVVRTHAWLKRLQKVKHAVH